MKRKPLFSKELKTIVQKCKPNPIDFEKYFFYEEKNNSNNEEQEIKEENKLSISVKNKIFKENTLSEKNNIKYLEDEEIPKINESKYDIISNMKNETDKRVYFFQKYFLLQYN